MKLQNKSIFILGATRFDGPDQSTSYHVANILSKENFVFYLDYPITWLDFLKNLFSPTIRKRLSHLLGFTNGIIERGNANFKIVISPLLISINFLPEGKLYRALLRVNETLIRKRIKRILNENKISDFIFINSFNFHYPGIAQTLNPDLTVYHCVDPMIIPYDMKHGIISENQLVEKSDLVICTSKKLWQEKKLLNKNTFFIPNAADFKHSSKALQKDLQVSLLLKGIKKPVIGYVGSIERRFDFELLKEVIQQNKDKTFVFVGGISSEFVPAWFSNSDNINIAGRIPYSDIPNILKGFDAAIIPFKKDDVSATIFPLKLFEYLGSGLPVISTNFNPDLEEFTRGSVCFCDDALSFSKAIDHAIKYENYEKRQYRISIAKENTWESRGNQISELIASNLGASLL